MEEDEPQQEPLQVEEDLAEEQGEKETSVDVVNDSTDSSRRGTYNVMIDDINNGEQPPLKSMVSEGKKGAPLSPPAPKKAPKITKV